MNYKGQIFLGNGESSGAQCFELMDLLHRALSKLSGIQQPPNPTIGPWGYENDYGQQTEDEAEVERIARYIYERLTGNEIVNEVQR